MTYTHQKTNEQKNPTPLHFKMLINKYQIFLLILIRHFNPKFLNIIINQCNQCKNVNELFCILLSYLSLQNSVYLYTSRASQFVSASFQALHNTMHVVATISDRAQLKDSRKASGKIRMCQNFVLLLSSFYSSILHWDAFLLPFSGPHALLFTFSL